MPVRCTALAAATTLVVATLSLVTAPPPAVAAVQRDDRPNILLITTDDQTTYDMKYLPRTRRLLGTAGVTFRSMLSPHPLCCPARAEILTGQYAHNNGVRSNAERFHGGWTFLKPDRTIATWLQTAGYSTAFVGKYLNNFPGSGRGAEPGWDIWNPVIHGVYKYFGYTMYENGDPQTYNDLHSSDLVSRRTVQYIEELAPADAPFFVWASHVAPHGECDGGCAAPARPAVRHRNLFRSVNSPSLKDPAFNEQNVADKPPYIAQLPKVEKSRMNGQFRSRIRTLQAVDEAVAAAVAALDRAGELDNTLILFTSDNGFVLGEHRYYRKDVPYEEALRVPLLVRGPGLPHDVDRKGVVTMVDIAPTIVDAADARANLVMDGRSILPQARSGRTRGYQTVLIQSGPRSQQTVDNGWFYRGVRTDRYTYVRYPDPFFVELYDRKLDPAQLTNVAGERKYRHVVRDLAERLRKLVHCRGAECRRRFG